MFIAAHAARSTKLRRSGTYSCSFALTEGRNPHPCRSYGACLGVRGGRYYKHGAPNGAGQASAVEEACKVQRGRAHSGVFYPAASSVESAALQRGTPIQNL